jgi:6-phosphogluconolactonase
MTEPPRPRAASRTNEVWVVPSARAVGRAAARLLVDEAVAAVARRSRAVVAVSGGATPRPMFAALAAAGRHADLDWSAVTILWADERRTAYSSRESNFGSALRVGLQRIVGVELVPMPVVGADAPSDARRYERALREALRGPSDRRQPLDAVVLGVGTDGHVASLFPGAAGLHVPRRLVVPTTSPAGGFVRLTMTLPMLTAARVRLILASGPGKAAIVAHALRPGPGAPMLPVDLVNGSPGRTVWIVDRAAAAGLSA